jgi:hypothetical protein
VTTSTGNNNYNISRNFITLYYFFRGRVMKLLHSVSWWTMSFAKLSSRKRTRKKTDLLWLSILLSIHYFSIQCKTNKNWTDSAHFQYSLCRMSVLAKPKCFLTRSALSKHVVVRSEQLSKWSRTYRIHGPGFEIHQNCSRDVFSTYKRTETRITSEPTYLTIKY